MTLAHPHINPFRTLDHVLDELRLLAVRARVPGADVYNGVNPPFDPLPWTLREWDHAYADATELAERAGIALATYIPTLEEGNRILCELAEVASGKEGVKFSESYALPDPLLDRLEELALATDETLNAKTNDPNVDEQVQIEFLRHLQRNHNRNRKLIAVRATREHIMAEYIPPAMVSEKSNQPPDEHVGAPVTVKVNGKGKNIDARMLVIIHASPESIGWSAQQWADHLNCSKGTIGDSRTWKGTLKLAKKLQAAEEVERMEGARTRTVSTRRRVGRAN